MSLLGKLLGRPMTDREFMDSLMSPTLLRDERMTRVDHVRFTGSFVDHPLRCPDCRGRVCGRDGSGALYWTGTGSCRKGIYCARCESARARWTWAELRAYAEAHAKDVPDVQAVDEDELWRAHDLIGPGGDPKCTFGNRDLDLTVCPRDPRFPEGAVFRVKSMIISDVTYDAYLREDEIPELIEVLENISARLKVEREKKEKERK